MDYGFYIYIYSSLPYIWVDFLGAADFYWEQQLMDLNIWVLIVLMEQISMDNRLGFLGSLSTHIADYGHLTIYFCLVYNINRFHGLWMPGFFYIYGT